MLKRLIILTAAILLTDSSIGQADTSRIKTLITAGQAYLKRDPLTDEQLDSTILIAHSVVSLSEQLHRRDDKYTGLFILADACLRRKHTAEGKKIFMEVIKEYRATGQKDKEAAAWSTLGAKIEYTFMTRDEITKDLEEAIRINQSIPNNEKKTSEAWIALADVQILQGKLNVAEDGLIRVVEFYRTHPGIPFTKGPYTHYLLAEIYRYKGDHNKALSNALQSLKDLDESTCDRCDLYYGELALIYQELGQPQESADWYKRTLEKRIGYGVERYDLYRTAGLLAQQLIILGRTKEALSILQDLGKKDPAVTAFEKACRDQGLGYCYNALHQYASAEKYFLDMIREYASAKVVSEWMDIADQDIGRFYIERQQYEKARPYLTAALANMLPGFSTLASRKDIHLLLFQVDSAAGKYLSAIQHVRLHDAINDSLFNETKSKQIEELQIRYETEKKDKDITLQQKNIQLLTKQGQLRDTELAKTRLLKNVTLGGIALLLIIVGLLYYSYRLKQKTNKALEAQQEEIREKNGSLQHLVNEKEWLLKEIHHRVKNNLQIIMSLLNSQSVYLQDDAALYAIRDSQHRVQAISLIHQKLYQSDNVSAIDMPVYIRDLVQYLRDSFVSANSIRFQLDIEPVELDVSQAVPLGLILNEGITNSFKYAFLKDSYGLISITLQQQAQYHFLLTIADNGVGMPAGFQDRKTGSLGMSLMKGLTEEIGGHFSIENKNGTLIKITFETSSHV